MNNFLEIYDLEIACVGEFKDFPQEVSSELEALLPVAHTNHFYILGMCFVGRNLTDKELDMLQAYKDEGSCIIDFVCRKRLHNGQSSYDIAVESQVE